MEILSCNEREEGRGREKQRKVPYPTLLYSTLFCSSLPYFPFLTSEKDRSPSRFEVKIISPSTTVEITLDPPDSRVTVSVPEKHILSKEDLEFLRDTLNCPACCPVGRMNEGSEVTGCSVGRKVEGRGVTGCSVGRMNVG
jgi:hypothetical protein